MTTLSTMSIATNGNTIEKSHIFGIITVLHARETLLAEAPCDQQTAGFGLNQVASQKDDLGPTVKVLLLFSADALGRFGPPGRQQPCLPLDNFALSFFLKVMHCHTLSSEEMSHFADSLSAGI